MNANGLSGTPIPVNEMCYVLWEIDHRDGKSVENPCTNQDLATTEAIPTQRKWLHRD